MAGVHRLTRCGLALLLVFFCAFAFATDQCTQYAWKATPSEADWYPTPDAAFASWAAGNPPGPGCVRSAMTRYVAPYAYYDAWCGSDHYVDQKVTLGTRTVNCPPPPWCELHFAGKDLGEVNWVTGASSSTAGGAGAEDSIRDRYWCEPVDDPDGVTKGCVGHLSPEFSYINAAGYWVAVGKGIGSSQPCDPANATGTGLGADDLAKGTGSATGPGKGDAQPGEVGESQCPAGKVPGEVNGTTICVTPGPDTPTVSKIDQSASSSTPDGTSTTGTSSITSCSDGKCTTTTTITVSSSSSSGGTSTSTVTGASTVSQSGYCKTRPDDPQCGDTSGFGGSCEAGFECSGDAVQCAAAKGIWDQKCALIDGPKGGTDPAELAAYKAATAASGAASGAGLGTTDVTISSQDFDQSNALGVAAQCVTDQQVTVWNTPVTIQFSKVCPYVEWLGSVMLGIAWLVAAVVVGKGVKG